VRYPIPLNKQPAVADSQAQMPVRDTVAQRDFSLPSIHIWISRFKEKALTLSRKPFHGLN
jgi:UDP-2-acetamido-2-deoxy-ribo-hexuluronate aminotransferase